MAILASSILDIDLDRLDHLVGRPLEVRNCLTVDVLIPKFTFSGIDPIALAILSLFNWAINDETANDRLARTRKLRQILLFRTAISPS